MTKTVNIERFRQLFTDELQGRNEVYEFTWVGKKAAIAEACKPVRKTLRPCPDESVDWNTTENIYIEGDNLDVLKLLQESYLEKVKMIYIDPPYNTGNDFIYQDNFTQNADKYNALTEKFDEQNRSLFKNTDYNGRFHSDWCSMIYSRLMLARNLLTKDGVIFISIDDHEAAALRLICDEIFGERNFIAQIVWEKVHTRKNSSINFSGSHEYILCYAKKKRENAGDEDGFRIHLLPRENTDAYANPDNDPKGPWKADPITAHNYYSADYQITKPDGTIIRRPKDRYWAFSEETWNRLVSENAVIWGNGDSMPMMKRYLCDVNDGLVPTTLFTRKFAGDTSTAKKNMDVLFDVNGLFDYTKPVKLLYRLLQISTAENDIVLDFFSGSGTTAQAVMEYNFRSNGHRKFIMVQIPEKPSENSIAFQTGYVSICELGKERIRRAGSRLKKEYCNTVQDQDTGFRVFKLADSNMNDIYYSADEYNQNLLSLMESNIKADRNDLDLIFGCLLEWGLPLSMPLRSEIWGNSHIHIYNDGDMIACFDEDIPESIITEIAENKPGQVVFRDMSFLSSPIKINVTEIFRIISPETKIKII
nr:site-specific DNA-methyltransferase [uncultured Acetatifactor sp.]